MPVEEAKKIAQEAHAEVCGKSEKKVHAYNRCEFLRYPVLIEVFYTHHCLGWHIIGKKPVNK